MAEKGEVTIERVFELLDEWRHLPAYQLERRADIFFALFLPKVLKKRFELDQAPIILIPEFPIKSREDNRPDRVDYLALKQSQKDERVCERGFLIELKTDMASIQGDQRRHLDKAAEKGLEHLVKDVLDICKTTDAKEKYVHLLYRLSELGLVDGVRERIDSLIENAASVDPSHESRQSKAIGRGRQFAKDLGGVKPANTSWPPSLEVVYVQPQSRNEISFNDFAETIESNGEMGRLFATYVRKWACCRPGSVNPKDLTC